MASSVVFKVKYGETLRRFNAFVKIDQSLELDMEGFQSKIRSLLNLPHDAEFTLTYLDEDNDQVTLADDEELHDVIRQGLNPVRVTVHLNGEKAASSFTHLGENSTPSRSSSEIVPQNSNHNDVKAFLSKLSLEMTSKAASDVVDKLLKIGQTLNASHSSDEVRNKPKTSSEAYFSCSEPAFKSSPIPTVVEPVKAVKPERTLLPPFVSNQKGKDADKHSCGTSGIQLSFKKDKGIIGDCSAKSAVNIPDFLKAQLKNHSSSEGTTEATHCNKKSSYGGIFPVNECPFSGISLPPGHGEGLYYPPYHRFVGSYNNNDGMGFIFHKGIRCDGCGVHPITGPRFKSKVKHDFDLCNICFARMGNYTEYTKIDFPSHFRLQDYEKVFSRHPPHRRLSKIMRSHGAKHLRSKLDNRFVMDVNIVDGTIMQPSTPFTKIWKMRNNGSIRWYPGLQLLWVGGDRFSSSDLAEIEVPMDGVGVGNELDIAVDFIAPELPGRYVSYWRMADSSGHMFGQRVWVLIEVDASMNDSIFETTPSLNLNEPPESNESMTFPDVNYVPPLDDTHELSSSLQTEKPVVVEVKPIKVEMLDLNFPFQEEDLLAASPTNSSVSAAASTTTLVSADNLVCAEASPISYPEVGGGDNHEQASSSAPVDQDKQEVLVEDNLLKELEEMGFKQVDMNNEVLKLNENDLQRSVDDLCDDSEWDHMLQELQEMGFNDKEMNKQLLEKNKGSIMRAVMDLVAGEKAAS